MGAIRELPGLHVTLDELVAVPPDSEDAPRRFVYFLTIHNDSSETVTIKGRKWVVAESNGQTLVVEGDGVVGEFPRLEPGEEFSYNSSHAITSDAVANGSLLGLTDAGEAVVAALPEFEMRWS